MPLPFSVPFPAGVHDRMLGQAVAKPANASLAATAAAPKKPPTLNSVCPKGEMDGMSLVLS